MTFHITRSGAVARCEATERSCPLGGEHFATMEAASVAFIEAQREQQDEPRMPWGRYKDQPLSVVAQDRSYMAWLLYKSDLRREDPALHRKLRHLKEVNDLRRDFYRT